MRMAGTSVLFLAAVLFLRPFTAAAINNDGQVVGHVVDQTGASLPGVTVTLHMGCRCQDCSDPVRCDCCPDAVVQVTNAQGEVRFLNLSAGSYTLAASLEGFSETVQDVTVASGRTTRLEVTMTGTRDP